MDDTPPDPLPPDPPETPGSPDLIDYDALPAFDTPAFLRTLGLCLGVPLVGILSQQFLLLVLSPLVWLVALVYGLGSVVSGQRAFGKAVLLGALVGGVVGFTLCSGLIL